MEGIWKILKQRVRKRVFRSIQQFKELLQDEWSKITMKEVRARSARDVFASDANAQVMEKRNFW
jgi:hypothetical protein